jgi:hypothetical protein
VNNADFAAGESQDIRTNEARSGPGRSVTLTTISAHFTLAALWLSRTSPTGWPTQR